MLSSALTTITFKYDELCFPMYLFVTRCVLNDVKQQLQVTKIEHFPLLIKTSGNPDATSEDLNITFPCPLGGSIAGGMLCFA